MDTIHNHICDTELPANGNFRHARFQQTANLVNIVIRQFGIRVRFTYPKSVSSFLMSVQIIRRSISNPKVFRVYAQAIIAIRTIMQYAQIIRNRTIVKYPAKAVGLFPRKITVRQLQLAVALWGSTTGPQPTCAGFLNTCKESLSDRIGTAMEARAGALTAAKLLIQRYVASKKGIADWAVTCYFEISHFVAPINNLVRLAEAFARFVEPFNYKPLSNKSLL